VRSIASKAKLQNKKSKHSVFGAAVLALRLIALHSAFDRTKGALDRTVAEQN
jgi:hypothetical protein